MNLSFSKVDPGFLLTSGQYVCKVARIGSSPWHGLRASKTGHSKPSLVALEVWGPHVAMHSHQCVEYTRPVLLSFLPANPLTHLYFFLPSWLL